MITKYVPQLTSYRYKKSINWYSRISWTLLQCFTCVWFQQCKIRSQLNQIVFATHCWRTRHWTHCHPEGRPVHLGQIWWYSAIWYIELFWRSNKPWLFLEGKQNLRKKRFFATIGFITLTKRRIQNFPHMTPFTVKFVAVTLLKPNTWTMLIYWQMDWQQKKPSLN